VARANESLQLTKRRVVPHRQPRSNPAASQLNSSVSPHDTHEVEMALGCTFICTNCTHAVNAWDEGDPYYVDEDGQRRYV
jgi:hypothetical protein